MKSTRYCILALSLAAIPSMSSAHSVVMGGNVGGVATLDTSTIQAWNEGGQIRARASEIIRVGGETINSNRTMAINGAKAAGAYGAAAAGLLSGAFSEENQAYGRAGVVALQRGDYQEYAKNLAGGVLATLAGLDPTGGGGKAVGERLSRYFDFGSVPRETSATGGSGTSGASSSSAGGSSAAAPSRKPSGGSTSTGASAGAALGKASGSAAAGAAKAASAGDPAAAAALGAVARKLEQAAKKESGGSDPSGYSRISWSVTGESNVNPYYASGEMVIQGSFPAGMCKGYGTSCGGLAVPADRLANYNPEKHGRLSISMYNYGAPTQERLDKERQSAVVDMDLKQSDIKAIESLIASNLAITAGVLKVLDSMAKGQELRDKALPEVLRATALSTAIEAEGSDRKQYVVGGSTVAVGGNSVNSKDESLKGQLDKAKEASKADAKALNQKAAEAKNDKPMIDLNLCGAGGLLEKSVVCLDSTASGDLTVEEEDASVLNYSYRGKAQCFAPISYEFPMFGKFSIDLSLVCSLLSKLGYGLMVAASIIAFKIGGSGRD